MAARFDDAARPTPDAVRHDVLALTSRVRAELGELDPNAVAPAGFDGLLRAGRELTHALARQKLDLLVDGGEALEQMAGLARTIAADQPDAAAAILGGVGRAVGVLEQSLDAVLEDGGAPLLESLGEALIAAFPEPWSSYLDDPPAEDSEPPRPRAMRSSEDRAPPRPDARDEDLLDAFEAETANALTRCEELILSGEDVGFEPDLAAVLDRELSTIQEACGATDLSEAARVLATGREILDSAGEHGAPWLADALLDVVDAAREIVEHSCGVDPDDSFSGEALWVELRERLALPHDAAPPGDPASTPFERLFRRLRVALCPRARIEVESMPIDLGIERSIGVRIEGALRHMLHDGFADPSLDWSAHPLARIRVAAERIGDSTLVVTLEDDTAAADDEPLVEREMHEPAASSKPEALHWIDVTRELEEADLTRLLYRPGFSNVVQILVPPKALRLRQSGGATP